MHGQDSLVELAELLELATAHGHTQTLTAQIIQPSQGTPRDVARAAALAVYRLAANQGHARAQNNLGVLFQKGLGVEQDLNSALSLYQLSAAQGNVTAQVNLASLHFSRGQFHEAAECFRLASERGHAAATNLLGVLTDSGCGVPRDPARAMELFEEAARLGYPGACDTIAKRRLYLSSGSPPLHPELLEQQGQPP